MKPSERLQKIAALRAQAESEAGARLADARAQLEQKNLQLEQLQTYRLEYHQRFVTSGGRGMLPEQLHDFHRFLGKIDAAIEHQMRLVQRGNQHLEQCRQKWLAEHGKVKSLTIATDNLRAKEDADSERSERRQIEDQTQQRFSRDQMAQD